MNLKNLIYSHTLCEGYGNTAGAVLDKIGAELHNKDGINGVKKYFKEKGIDIDNLKAIELGTSIRSAFNRIGVKNHKDCKIGLFYCYEGSDEKDFKNQRLFIFDYINKECIDINFMRTRYGLHLTYTVKELSGVYGGHSTIACFGVKTE